MHRSVSYIFIYINFFSNLPASIIASPQGTYHQCRNVKPCLSYSRFHLDEVNLPAFLQSLFDGDATELLQGA